jgi:hypothetical protein
MINLNTDLNYLKENSDKVRQMLDENFDDDMFETLNTLYVKVDT